MAFPPDQPTPHFPYQIEARIGEGAMGLVYRAVEPALERPVAIKVLRPQLLAGEEPAVAREHRQRFLQEARAAAALSHPGVTTIYRIGEEEGTPYIAMEWLAGHTLEQVLRDEGLLAPERAARLGLELLAALDAAHRSGVVHRDIKPANLVLLHDGRLKVTDFGIARLRGSDLVKTQAGFVLATPRFASPEQLRGEEVDGRSDLFSVGILLYQTLTGSTPFRGDDFYQVATAVFRDEPAPLRTVNPAVPVGLAAVIEKALRKEREDRWQSAADMRSALEAALAETSFALAEVNLAASPTRATRRPAMPSAGAPVLQGLPREAWQAAVAAARSWKSRDLGVRPTRPLLDRLVDRPLHAPAFAGAARIGDAFLFFADGLLLGAVDVVSGDSGDAVVEHLPALAPAELHPAPEPEGPRLARVLAALLHPPKPRHGDLDSSFVNLPALGAKLQEEGFDGILRFCRPDSCAWLLFCAGRPALALYSTGWDGVPIEQPWEEWVSGVALRAHVEESAAVPAFFSYRRELRNRELAVELRPGEPAEKNRLLGGTRRLPATAVLAPQGTPCTLAPLEGDPVHRFLRWSLEELAPFFRERDKAGKWKYLVEWLAEVRTARLHHDLPHPGSGESDTFDLATFDGDGRALHLADRVAHATPEVLDDFRRRVIRAKTARLKTGDVGAALLVARRFDDATLDAWRAGLKESGGSGRWSFEEAFTRYEGFVRIGPRRGFHLLLVEEAADGSFTPVLP